MVRDEPIVQVLAGPFGPDATYRRVRIRCEADADKLRGTSARSLLVLYRFKVGRRPALWYYLRDRIIAPLAANGAQVEWAELGQP